MKKVSSKSEKVAWENLEQGHYSDCYVVYNRKSTDEADNQKNSISYQKSENVRFAKREGLKIADFSIKGFCADGIVSEKHSGFKEDDDIFFTEDGMVQYRIERPPKINPLLGHPCE